MLIKIDLNKVYKDSGKGKGGPQNLNPANPVPIEVDVNPEGEGALNPMIEGAKSEPKKGVRPVWMRTIFELSRKPERPHKFFYQIDHPFGRKLVVPFAIMQYFKKYGAVYYFEQKSRKREFDRFKSDVADKGNKVKHLIYLARWAFQRGLLDDFRSTMLELNVAQPKLPIYEAFAEAEKIIGAKNTKDDPRDAKLIQQLKAEGFRSYSSPHYLLLTNLPNKQSEEKGIKKRLELMEKSYANFFHWFAMSGAKVPAAPKHRLLAVLVRDRKDFHTLHVKWGKQPMVGDGFTPRRENVMILSPEPLSDNFIDLEKKNKRKLGDLNLFASQLISGKIWKKANLSRLNPLVLAEYSEVQTITVMLKALEAESIRATTTHQSMRQLLFATGVLPQNVVVPRWVSYGLASLLDTPRGAPYMSVGMPSWSNLVPFRYYLEEKKIKPTAQTVYNVVTDEYFRRADLSADVYNEAQEDPDGELRRKRTEDRELAQSTAWALVYYLATKDMESSSNEHLRQLLGYCDELRKLPRDLQLNQRLLAGVFGRAFKLQDPKTGNLSRAGVQNFADGWFSHMSNIHLMPSSLEIEALEARKAPTPEPESETNPMIQPGLPGGIQPPPGAGAGGS